MIEKEQTEDELALPVQLTKCDNPSGITKLQWFDNNFIWTSFNKPMPDSEWCVVEILNAAGSLIYDIGETNSFIWGVDSVINSIIRYSPIEL